MKAYRVEDPEKRHGIWRDFDGTVNPVFTKLTNGKCKDMPMPDSDFYRYGGKQWFAATDTPEKLTFWLSAQDIAELELLGYDVYEFEVSEYRTVSEYEICFPRESITSVRRINPFDIWGNELIYAYALMVGDEHVTNKQLFDLALCHDLARVYAVPPDELRKALEMGGEK